jgi:hypothetical protein
MHTHLELPASYEVSVRSLAGLGVNVADDGFFYQLTGTLAGFLPTVRCLAAVALASCLFLYELFIWYTDL